VTRSQSILGSTGSNGESTLKLVSAHREQFSIACLSAAENVQRLAEQALTFRAQRAVIANEAHYAALKNALSGSGVEAAAGEQAMLEAAAMPADITMSAIVGIAALKPTLEAIRRGGVIALANKESLVCAGELMMAQVRRHGATLIPVDSEHNAIFQLMHGHSPHDWGAVEHVTLTASGGPFRDFTLAQMRDVTPAQAVKHPNWAMGAKISVDSATLMNKGLEMIEAFRLFPLAPEQIRAVIHPQSMLHCLVAMCDGSVLAQLSQPDMCTPIAFALGWPARLPAPVKKLALHEAGPLEFFAPDEARFPALRLAQAALKQGGSAPTVLNAANEVAVAGFLRGQLRFTDIANLVERTLEKSDNTALNSLDDVLACDREARATANRLDNAHA
jgi:1-deoxy-D-xylulose-5-phosphate reductoisomerase